FLPSELSSKGEEIGNGRWLVTLDLPAPVTLDDSGQVYTITARTDEVGPSWSVPKYNSETIDPGGIIDLNYDGSRSAFVDEDDGTLSWITDDTAFHFLKEAAPPSGFSVAESDLSMSDLGSCDCSTHITSAMLAWTASTDTDVTMYEVQRRNDDTDWQTVAIVDDITWIDFG